MADVKVPLPDAADRATRLLTQITNGEWSAARADFTDVVAGSLDEDGLRETWEHVTENLDGYQGTMGTPEITTKKLLTIVTVPPPATAPVIMVASRAVSTAAICWLLT